MLHNHLRQVVRRLPIHGRNRVEAPQKHHPRVPERPLLLQHELEGLPRAHGIAAEDEGGQPVAVQGGQLPGDAAGRGSASLVQRPVVVRQALVSPGALGVAEKNEAASSQQGGRRGRR